MGRGGHKDMIAIVECDLFLCASFIVVCERESILFVFLAVTIGSNYRRRYILLVQMSIVPINKCGIELLKKK